MHWNHYLHDTGHAIQKGLQTGLHILEGGLATAATLKGAWELAGQAAPYVRSFAAMAAPAALL